MPNICPCARSALFPFPSLRQSSGFCDVAFFSCYDSTDRKVRNKTIHLSFIGGDVAGMSHRNCSNKGHTGKKIPKIEEVPSRSASIRIQTKLICRSLSWPYRKSLLFFWGGGVRENEGFWGNISVQGETFSEVIDVRPLSWIVVFFFVPVVWVYMKLGVGPLSLECFDLRSSWSQSSWSRVAVFAIVPCSAFAAIVLVRRCLLSIRSCVASWGSPGSSLTADTSSLAFEQNSPFAKRFSQVLYP